MPQFNVNTFFLLLGSIALFLFGMKVMSEGIQKLAGQRLRKNFSSFTNTPLKGIFSGTLVTALLQSSSATTVVVVGLAHAGVVSLMQAIWLVMGANIGTTATGWIVTLLGMGTFKLTALALPMLAISTPMFLTRRSTIRSTGETLTGLALLLLGLSFIRAYVPDVQGNPEWLQFLSSFQLTGGLGDLYAKALLFFLVGALLTLIVQSSSVAMAITLVMTAEGWIPFPMGLAIILGENLGTTATANIAALVGNVHAKRTARAHTLFNLLGAVWVLAFFPLIISLLDSFTTAISGFSPMDNPEVMPLALSTFHTGFNLLNTLLLAPFTPWLVKLVTRWTPSKSAFDEAFRLEFIGGGLMETTELSLLEARKEIMAFARNVRQAFAIIPRLLVESDEAEVVKQVEKIRQIEEFTDQLQVELANYLTSLSQGEISEDASKTVRNLLNAGNQLERATDLILKCAINVEKRRHDKAYFTPQHRKAALEVAAMVQRALVILVDNAEKGEGRFNLDAAMECENTINARIEELQRQNLSWIETEQVKLTSGLYFSDLMNEFERVADNVYKAQKALAGLAGH